MRKNGELTRKNGELMRKNGELTRKNGELMRKNGELKSVRSHREYIKREDYSLGYTKVDKIKLKTIQINPYSSKATESGKELNNGEIQIKLTNNINNNLNGNKQQPQNGGNHNFMNTNL
eukprot:GHVR01045467.1.p1 GENE.GHVR01045467.1~~GHVR01045467.1.p1  ORF type:complete len:119 (+),score=5.72 GHVR01045467.1:5609-5965(+)